MSKEKNTLEKIKAILFGEQKPAENTVESNLADAPAAAPEAESDGQQADEDSAMEALANAIADLQTRVANIEAELGDQANADGSTADGMMTSLRKMRQVVELMASQPQSNPVRKTEPTPYADKSAKINSVKEQRQKELGRLFAEVRKNTNTTVAQPKSLKEERNITPSSFSNKDGLFNTTGNVTNMTGGFQLRK